MTAMRDRAVIGSRWQRKRDRTTWQVIQSHRADRLVELAPLIERSNALGTKDYVPFTVLRNKYREVQS